jgi:hypothetical protein
MKIVKNELCTDVHHVCIYDENELIAEGRTIKCDDRVFFDLYYVIKLFKRSVIINILENS